MRARGEVRGMSLPFNVSAYQGKYPQYEVLRTFTAAPDELALYDVRTAGCAISCFEHSRCPKFSLRALTRDSVGDRRSNKRKKAKLCKIIERKKDTK